MARPRIARLHLAEATDNNSAPHRTRQLQTAVNSLGSIESLKWAHVDLQICSSVWVGINRLVNGDSFAPTCSRCLPTKYGRGSKKRYPNGATGKWNQGLTPPWWFNLDPHPYVSSSPQTGLTHQTARDMLMHATFIHLHLQTVCPDRTTMPPFAQLCPKDTGKGELPLGLLGQFGYDSGTSFQPLILLGN